MDIVKIVNLLSKFRV